MSPQQVWGWAGTWVEASESAPCVTARGWVRRTSVFVPTGGSWVVGSPHTCLLSLLGALGQVLLGSCRGSLGVFVVFCHFPSDSLLQLQYMALTPEDRNQHFPKFREPSPFKLGGPISGCYDQESTQSLIVTSSCWGPPWSLIQQSELGSRSQYIFFNF